MLDDLAENPAQGQTIAAKRLSPTFGRELRQRNAKTRPIFWIFGEVSGDFRPVGRCHQAGRDIGVRRADGGPGPHRTRRQAERSAISADSTV
jgi:hypothetical protein